VPFCSSCGSEVAPDVQFCSKCGKQLQVKKYEFEEIEKWEYLWPILFGILGGLFLYFRYRYKNPKAARDGLLIGIGISVIGFIIMGVLGASL